MRLLDGFGAAEFFATTLDVYLLLEHVNEDAADCHTADGRPATRTAAHARLARMLCGDGETLRADFVIMFAARAFRRQTQLIGTPIWEAARCLPALPTAVVLAGSGEFLARLVLQALEKILPVTIVSLAQELGPELSAAACAHAVAVLATEGRHDG